MVILHFRSLYERAEQTWTTIGGGLLQVGVSALYVFAKKLRRPLRSHEVIKSCVDVVWQVPFGLSQILDFGYISLQSRAKNRVHHHVWIRIRAY